MHRVVRMYKFVSAIDYAVSACTSVPSLGVTNRIKALKSSEGKFVQHAPMSSPVTVLGFDDIVPTSCAVKIVTDGGIAKQVEACRGCFVLWSDQAEVHIDRDCLQRIITILWVRATRCASFAFAKRLTKRR